MISRVLIPGILLLLVALPAHGEYEACGSLDNKVGPFDYRTNKGQLEIVERFHFTPSVENLIKGNTGPLGGDLSYTLRASPNHARALAAMANLALRDHTDQPHGAKFTIQCFFDRAIRFAPDDGTVYMIYGTYLFRSGAKAKGLKALETAEHYSLDSGNLHYNLGLVYFDAKEYDKALLHAQKAYALGFSLPGLRNKLVAAGKWRDARDANPVQAGTPASSH